MEPLIDHMTSIFQVLPFPLLEDLLLLSSMDTVPLIEEEMLNKEF
jgi:hypothetical protein